MATLNSDIVDVRLLLRRSTSSMVSLLSHGKFPLVAQGWLHFEGIYIASQSGKGIALAGGCQTTLTGRTQQLSDSSYVVFNAATHGPQDIHTSWCLQRNQGVCSTLALTYIFMSCNWSSLLPGAVTCLFHKKKYSA